MNWGSAIAILPVCLCVCMGARALVPIEVLNYVTRILGKIREKIMSEKIQSINFNFLHSVRATWLSRI